MSESETWHCILVPNIASNVYWPFTFSVKCLLKSLVFFSLSSYFNVIVVWFIGVKRYLFCTPALFVVFSISKCPFSPQSQVAKAGLEFLILLPPPSKCWGCMCLVPRSGLKCLDLFQNVSLNCQPRV